MLEGGVPKGQIQRRTQADSTFVNLGAKVGLFCADRREVNCIVIDAMAQSWTPLGSDLEIIRGNPFFALNHPYGRFLESK